LEARIIPERIEHRIEPKHLRSERHAYSRGASYGIEKIAGEFAGRLVGEGPRVSQSKGSLGYVKSRAALASHQPDED